MYVMLSLLTNKTNVKSWLNQIKGNDIQEKSQYSKYCLDFDTENFYFFWQINFNQNVEKYSSNLY